MQSTLPAGIFPGEIYRDIRNFQDTAGDWKTKYLLILAGNPGGDIICRLLTSRPHARPKTPRCFHGLPYPGFYLGYLGDPLTGDSWLDLRETDDYDGGVFLADIAGGTIAQVLTLPKALVCAALDCVANADDTTRLQERCIRDVRAALGCP